MNMNSANGFTLVEFLVAILLTAILMGGVYSVYRVQTRTVKAQESRLEAQDYARTVLDIMVREIRNAMHDPTGITSGTDCAGNGNPPGVPGIVVATAQTLQFTLDADGDGDCDGPNEDITYTYNAGTQEITRAVDGGTAQNLTNGNATGLQFTYFAQDSVTAMSPIITANIQRVQIALTIQSQSPDTEFGGGILNATMTSNADLRNR
jgi:prepilin-type N-terminal cleavage/methylation domain-containing protein